MPHFKIHASWSCAAVLDIEAESMDDAIELAGDTELDDNYIDNSWEVHRGACEKVDEPSPPAQASSPSDFLDKFARKIRDLKECLDPESMLEEVDMEMLEELNLMSQYHLSLTLAALDSAETYAKIAKITATESPA